jgi:ABC-2 type transport system permease protein
MNTQYASSPPTTPVATLAAAPTRFTTFVTLVRRELWEHAALWRSALIAAVLLLGAVLVGVFVGHNHVMIAGGDDEILGMSAGDKAAAFTISQVVIAALLFLVILCVLTFYLLDCLYAERKDRSILFWKSLPVSDGMTVMSKLLVAVAVVPLGVFLLAILTHLAFWVLWQLGVAMGHVPAVLSWDTLAWIKVNIAIFLCVVLAALWYAPLAAALLFVSAAVRRSPIMWATLPVIFVPVLEYIAFRTRYVWQFLQYRTHGIWKVLAEGHVHPEKHHIPNMDSLLSLNFSGAFLEPNLWLGLVATAALVYAAVRMRRYRDDT